MRWFFKEGGWKVVLAGALFGLGLAGASLRPGECVGWKEGLRMCGGPHQP